MTKRIWTLLWLAAVLVAPSQAKAFSFGTFASGDTIIEIELSAAVSTGVVFDNGADPSDPTDDTLTFESSVSTITMQSGAVFSPVLGTVLVSSVVSPLAGTTQFFPTILGSELKNGIVADLTITDIGIGGAGMILEADYVGSVSFTASQFFSGFPVTGSLSGDFNVTGGDTDFVNAFGTTGNFFSELAGWQVGGSAASVLCDLTNGFYFSGNCIGPTDFVDFTAQPTTTIVPTAVPEPGVGLILGAAGLMLGALRKR